MSNGKKSKPIANKANQKPSPIVVEKFIKTESQPHNETAKNEKKNICKRIFSFLFGKNVLANVIMAVFTVCIFCVDQGIKDIYAHQLSVQRIETRAWLVVNSITKSDAGSGTFFYTVYFKNIGKTPATEIHVCINGAERTIEIPSLDLGHDPNQASGYIGPESNHFFVDWTKKPASRFIYGTVWYRDIYHILHWVQFCYQMTPDRKSFCAEAEDFHNEEDKNED